MCGIQGFRAQLSRGLAWGLMLPLALAPAAAPAAAGPAAAANQQAFSETTQVTAVEIPVQVVRNGEPVRGLTAADFEIWEGRKQQAITGFDMVDLAVPENQRLSAPIPAAGRRHFLLIFDLSNSQPKYVMKARDAASRSLLPRLLPSDLVAVATYGFKAGMHLALGFTSDRRQIVKAIDTLGYTDLADRSQQPHLIGAVDAIANAYQSMQTMAASLDTVVPGQTRGRDVGNAARGQAQAALALAELQLLLSQVIAQSKANQRMDQAEVRNDVTAMTHAFANMARMMDAVSGRKLVVLFSEGFDSSILEGDQHVSTQEQLADLSMLGGGWMTESDTRYGSTSENQQLEKMMEVFRRSGCVIESVDIGGLRGDTDMADRGGQPGETALFQMARDTGGELYHNFNDLGDAMSQLAKSTAVTYVLTFQPQGPLAAGSYHAIKVKLKNEPRGTRVTYKPGYYAPRPYKQLPAAERLLAVADQMMSTGASGSIQTAVLAAPFRTAAEKAYVPVVVEADGGTLLAGGDGKIMTAELYVNAVDAQGAIQDSFDQRMQLDVEKAGPALRQGGLKFFGHLELPPGDFSVRVMLRNGETGAYGKRSILVTVPAFGTAAPVLLQPFFPDAAGRWTVVRERPRGAQQNVSYPFVVGQRAYVPAALPILTPGQQAAVALVGYNLGEGELAAQAKVQSADGRDLGAGEISVAGRVPGDGAGPDVYRAVFRAPQSLAPGEYRLVVTITGASGSQTVTSRFTVAAAARGNAGTGS
ncbi:MAG TPA: VWA domain-containing protein [Thermoanaerobaculia bacterium]|nr:VWA domain-containing protein [Thermoanaerobaculia bacterium]